MSDDKEAIVPLPAGRRIPVLPPLRIEQSVRSHLQLYQLELGMARALRNFTFCKASDPIHEVVQCLEGVVEALTRLQYCRHEILTRRPSTTPIEPRTEGE